MQVADHLVLWLRWLQTDTVPLLEKQKLCPKIRVVPIGSLLAEAIHNVHTGESLSLLFEEGSRKFRKKRYSNN